MKHDIRTEHDSLGPMDLPRTCLWGINTQRAIENFPISGMPLSHFPEFVRALASVKKAAARVNADLRVLSPQKARVIEEVCDEIIAGCWHDEFRVDMIQGGAGTSTNMNMNEVIANLGLIKSGHQPGDYAHLHPNDDVNRSQSTNDVYPTAMRLAIVSQCEAFSAAQMRLAEAFRDRAAAFCDIRKIGRTQLQDAVPMTLGQEFTGFAVTIHEDVEIIGRLKHLLLEVNLGGTAIGTQVNTPDGYAEAVVAELSRLTGLPVKLAGDLIEASSDTGAYVTFSSTMAAEAGQLQLNAFEPVIILNILQSMRILGNAMDTLATKCVQGIQADAALCEDMLENSLVLATMLVPYLGYSVAAEVAKMALVEQGSVREAAVKLGIGTQDEIDAMLA
ncbi:lyase family protein [Cribrihabitans sp. XS_ASV171]